ncbi:hypothetical protein [Streptomyces griseus]|uniref:hypothetical protein n=1 Tax=Streptomyces griseus TaxID=1911 RepID=UPI0037A9323F
MSAPMTPDREQEIRADLAAVPAPPWRWIGSRGAGGPQLVTDHSGREYLLRAAKPADHRGDELLDPETDAVVYGDLEFRDQREGETYSWMRSGNSLAVGRTEYDPDSIVGVANPIARWVEKSAQHTTDLLAEVERLRIDRDVCRDWADTLAYKVAPVEVLGRHGEEGKYPWGDALELLTPAAEVDALEARHAAVLSLHRKHSDSEHCFADDETWPCQTLIALGRTDAEPPSPTENAAELRADNDRLRARVAELEGDLDAGVNAAVRDALVGSAVREARAEVLTEAVALIQANPHPGDDPAAFYASLLQDQSCTIDSEAGCGLPRVAPEEHARRTESVAKLRALIGRQTGGAS